jgi:hypothetical protein
VRTQGGPGLPEGAYLRLPDYEAVRGSDPASLRAFAEHFILQSRNAEALGALPLAEKSDDRWVVQNTPPLPLDTAELDRGCTSFPTPDGPTPCMNPQGRPRAQGGRILPGLQQGLLRRLFLLRHHVPPGTGGSRQEPGIPGPGSGSPDGAARLQGLHPRRRRTDGEFPGSRLRQAEKGGACANRECLHPAPCPNLRIDHREYLDTLRALRRVAGVKKVFIRSGIRFDYLLADERGGDEFLRELCEHHVSGQLKVAPEHVSARVLDAMGKSGNEVYEEFRRRFAEANRRLGAKQYLVPYFISSHPAPPWRTPSSWRSI